ncbi:MAG: DNA/RNA non-specific endonuclease [Pseudomonadota bacterium]
MTDPIQTLQRLRKLNAEFKQADRDLTEEISDTSRLAMAVEFPETPDAIDGAIGEESIIMRRFRPALRVIGDTTELEFEDPQDIETWRARLVGSKEQLDAAIRAVGRINLQNGKREWVGTGWLIRANVVVTNRHVADFFVSQGGTGFTFVTGIGGPFSAEVDFLQEFDNPSSRAFRLIKPLYVAPRRGPDIAFLEVEQVAGNDALANPIALAAMPRETNNVAVIGYPASDSRIPDYDLMQRIYGGKYNKKRVAPGAVTAVTGPRVLHNCTTLGGNSGSAVIDLDSGEALGLHYSGSFMRTNYAVRADLVEEVLNAVLRGGRPYWETVSAPPPPAPPPPAGPVLAWQSTGNSTTVTIPLNITVSLGAPGGAQPTATTPPIPGPAVVTGDDDDIDDSFEARPEDFLDREGYLRDFLADGSIHCPFPSVVCNPTDVLTFQFDNRTESELRYQHFSVVMSRKRRLCYFSAVNINGAEAKKAKRRKWRRDPRILESQQIIKECYGSPPKFSRGHMTRRNDPSWGSATLAKRGNTDSMHVTNATPQMQAFNSPIWLELEDYALDNAIDDRMRISVFTGPFFRDDDPVYDGVAVPVSFWKIIAFIHDETRELTATGYRMTQEASLPTQEEFVFGQFTSTKLGVATQTSICSIETASGISFNGLADLDPLSQEEAVGRAQPETPLLSRHQIRFI